jgi:hypothetical protein
MQKFTVWSDHRPLMGIWRKQIDEIGNARCQKWRENLSIYNFNVEWEAGKTHNVADSLSRAPYWDLPEVDSVFCFAINPTQGIHDILRKAAAEEDYKGILEAVNNGASVKSIADRHPAAALRSEWDYLSVINGLFVHDCKRIVIPRGARDATLQVLHRSHAGVAKRAETAKQLYFWPKMNEHIKDMIDACERCQFYKSSKQRQEQIQQTPFKDLYPMAEVGADLFKAGKPLLHHRCRQVLRISARCETELNDRRINHRAHGKNVLFTGQVRGNQMRQRTLLQDRVQELGQGERHRRQQLRPIVKHMLLKHHLNH